MDAGLGGGAMTASVALGLDPDFDAAWRRWERGATSPDLLPDPATAGAWAARFRRYERCVAALAGL